MSKPAIAALCLSLLVGGSVRPARAQFADPTGGLAGHPPNIEGFTVVGKGFVAARPDLAEIDLDVVASSELTADAIVKYRDAKRRIRDAFAALKLKSVTVDERGLLVDQKGTTRSPYFFDSQPNTRTKTEVQLTRKLVVKAADIRTMDEDAVLQLVGRLLDVAQDAGGKLGGQQNTNDYYYYRWGERMNQATGGLVRFVLEDFDKIEDEAYVKAIADARTRALRLARLSQVELGPIVAVREIAVPGDRNANAEEQPARKRLETAKFQEISVRVELLVRFEVHHKAEGKARNP